MDEDLYFITDDSDYQSEIDKSMFDPYLSNEWGHRKGSKIIYQIGIRARSSQYVR